MFARRGIAAALLFCAAAAGAVEYNLLPVDSFTPLYMHGKASAAKGWLMRDQPREAAFKGANPEYVSGDDCFKLEFSDGALTVRFLEPLNDIYVNETRSIRMEADTVRPLPPAPEYRFTGKTKFNRGVLVNMDAVLTIQDDVMRMKTGDVHPLRTRGRGALMARFAQYQLTRMRGGKRP